MLAIRTPRYEGIDPRSWEHPADKAALAAVRQMRGSSAGITYEEPSMKAISRKRLKRATIITSRNSRKATALSSGC